MRQEKGVEHLGEGRHGLVAAVEICDGAHMALRDKGDCIRQRVGRRIIHRLAKSHDDHLAHHLMITEITTFSQCSFGPGWQ